MADEPTFIEYNSTGSTTDFVFPFDYISAQHISVTVAGVARAYTLISQNTIRISPAPSGLVRIARVTPGDPMVVWADGDIMLGANLNRSVEQPLYVAQEARDLSEAAIDRAEAAEAAAALAAIDAANHAIRLSGTSTTSHTVGAGSKTFTTQTNRFFTPGGSVLIVSDSNPGDVAMTGTVVSYSGTQLVVVIEGSEGTGTFADWSIFISGRQGMPGTNGADGSGAIQVNVLDSLETHFDGTSAVFGLTRNSATYVPKGSQWLQVVYRGVLQTPGTDYNVSSNLITFSTPPEIGASCIIRSFDVEANGGDPIEISDVIGLPAALAALEDSFVLPIGMSDVSGLQAALDGKAPTGQYATLNTTAQVLTGGFAPTPLDLGSITSGTLTVNPGARPVQSVTNNGPFAIAFSGTVFGWTLLAITNGSTPGAMAFGAGIVVDGDPFDTVAGHRFLVGVYNITAGLRYAVVKALG